MQRATIAITRRRTLMLIIYGDTETMREYLNTCLENMIKIEMERYGAPSYSGMDFMCGKYKREYFIGMVVHRIRNNEQSVLGYCDAIIPLGEGKHPEDPRIPHVSCLIDNVLRRFGLPDMDIIIFYADRFLYELRGLPYMAFTKEVEYPGFIIPDGTFFSLSTSSKYGEECLNYDQMKTRSREAIAQRSPTSRENKIFFNGAPTGRKDANTRNIFNNVLSRPSMARLRMNDFAVTIGDQVFTKSGYTPIYTWNRYKFLLNLPGHYPWSNRLKFLYLNDSLTFDLITRREQKDVIGYRWITVIDYFIGGCSPKEAISGKVRPERGEYGERRDCKVDFDLELGQEDTEESYSLKVADKIQEMKTVKRSITDDRYTTMTTNTMAIAYAIDLNFIEYYMYKICMAYHELTGGRPVEEMFSLANTPPS